MNHAHDEDLMHKNELENTDDENSQGQIAFVHKGNEMQCLVASAEPRNGGYWNMYLEGRRVGMFTKDLKTRTGD